MAPPHLAAHLFGPKVIIFSCSSSYFQLINFVFFNIGSNLAITMRTLPLHRGDPRKAWIRTYYANNGPQTRLKEGTV